ncbi:MAG: hypothetical protein FGM57_03830 [Candidatus Taylorbacteria bacterium]|nr:hypothetical protein [Candidatus Taylorbacteria bacterium]
MNTIAIIGELDVDRISSIKRKVQALLDQPACPIEFYIDSPGGLAKETYEIMEMLLAVRRTQPERLIRAKIVKAHSAAALFAIIANERVMTPRSTIILHTGTREISLLDINVDTGKLRKGIIEELRHYQQQLLRYLELFMKLDLTQYTCLTSIGLVKLSANTCEERGFATITPELKAPTA